MNAYDSDRIVNILKPLDYELTNTINRADLILLNTCAIREKAQQKAFSFLGRLAVLKKKKKALIIGVCGCVAQQEGERIIDRLPHVDIVLGTHAIDRLPDIIVKIEKEKCHVIDVQLSEVIKEFCFDKNNYADTKVFEFVTIMRGCDNFCTYCVVPHVRGRETSRKPENIINEIKALIKNGTKEVILLGQNVNSYGKKDGLCTFAELISMVNEIEKLYRIRFTTSHPKDLSDELINSFKRLDKLCPHIHLPVQSGSDTVLKRMNRKYTTEFYLKKIQKLRSIIPDIAISSDFIVGFPKETKADFQKTLNLIKKVEFDFAFAFIYSPRPNTPAAKFSGAVLEEEKKARLQQLLKVQEYYTRKKNEKLVGTKTSVLVEGFSKRSNLEDIQKVQWTGRTNTNKIVNFSESINELGNKKIVSGQLLNIKIEKAFSHSLWGEPI